MTTPELPARRNGSVSFEEAQQIARKHAKAEPESYYSEPFEPHLWVINAIIEASATWYDRAVEERIRRVAADREASEAEPMGLSDEKYWALEVAMERLKKFTPIDASSIWDDCFEHVLHLLDDARAASEAPKKTAKDRLEEVLKDGEIELLQIRNQELAAALGEAMHEYDELDLTKIGPQHWYTKAKEVLDGAFRSSGQNRIEPVKGANE